mgnify:CR=1 FL=1
MEEKSEGNFMYLHYVLPEIEKGAYQDLELDKLPAGLQNYYEDHWRRMGMTDKPLPKDKIKIIYILSLLPEPLSIEQLSKLTNEDFYNVQNVINEWVAFLHDHIREADTKKRYSFYHESFRDFLHRNDIIKAAKVTLPGINDIIAKQLLLRFKT